MAHRVKEKLYDNGKHRIYYDTHRHSSKPRIESWVTVAKLEGEMELSSLYGDFLHVASSPIRRATKRAIEVTHEANRTKAMTIVDGLIRAWKAEETTTDAK